MNKEIRLDNDDNA